MPGPATVAEVLAAVAALPSGRTRFVGVDGFGAAGKSQLAAAIVAAVPGHVVHVDDLQGPGIAEWDWAVLNHDVVTPLLSSRDARYAVRAWGEAGIRGHAEVPAGSLVVVEGVSSTRAEAQVPWDLTVWVDAPEAVRRQRALDRDGIEAQAVWTQSWIPLEQAYAARERPWERVDLVVDGTS